MPCGAGLAKYRRLCNLPSLIATGQHEPRKVNGRESCDVAADAMRGARDERPAVHAQPAGASSDGMAMSPRLAALAHQVELIQFSGW